MKKLIVFSMMCLMALSMNTISAQDFNNFITDSAQDFNNFITERYVDLGLPSGTLWKNRNEVDEEIGSFFTYEQAKSRFGNKLPTKDQFQELKNKCSWSWTGKGYIVTGPNGNSIVLPAAGYRGCRGSVGDVGSYGYYWSSTPYGSEIAWTLDFNSGGVYMDDDNRCYGYSVRLVQD